MKFRVVKNDQNGLCFSVSVIFFWSLWGGFEPFFNFQISTFCSAFATSQEYNFKNEFKK